MAAKDGWQGAVERVRKVNGRQAERRREMWRGKEGSLRTRSYGVLAMPREHADTQICGCEWVTSVRGCRGR